ncbi:thermonuclease family protein [Mycoplasma sp. 1018B]|uniref:thermonuclease family protein n=1 Tax=Mycoplasma sp. 1018B TaxID=2967302 RepID=UPI00211C8861|nr:thermonuclease family protein [Mycoplasma sp. 1018B]UUM19139.1 thermonuclease family protein [Mycoplasma sp. 1018B]
MKKIIAIIQLSLIFLIFSCINQSFLNKPFDQIYTTKIIDNYDGDTFKIIINNQIETIRVFAIDTLEINSTNKKDWKYAKQAKNFTSKFLKMQPIKILYLRDDVYERKVCIITNSNNEDLASELIKNGLARIKYIDIYNHKSPFYIADVKIKKYLNNLQDIEEKSKRKQIGIFENY